MSWEPKKMLARDRKARVVRLERSVPGINWKLTFLLILLLRSLSSI